MCVVYVNICVNLVGIIINSSLVGCLNMVYVYVIIVIFILIGILLWGILWKINFN